MLRSLLVAGIISAALAVAFGAFGAHGLKKLVDAEGIDVFKTGVQYQFYHALALIITAVLSQKKFDRRIKWAGNFFLAGIFFFSGSLYAITLCKAMESAVPKLIFLLTPLGGVFFICGWVALFFTVFKNEKL